MNKTTRGTIGARWRPVLASLLCLGLVFACSDDDDPVTNDGKVVQKDGGAKEASAKEASVKEAGVKDAKPDASGKTAEVIILHTNDLHDHLLGYPPNTDYTPGTKGDDTTLGGMARVVTRIKTERAAATKAKVPMLVLDAGDYSMGSSFSWLNTTAAPMLNIFQKAGYDAITLGNHEFDWGPKALAGSIAAAMKGGFKVPILASNTVFSSTDKGDDELAALKTAGAIKNKLVKTLSNGMKVGFFGILGKTAASLSPLAKPVTFADQVTAAKAVVKELTETDKVDLVIAVSHSGTNAKGDTGDDVTIAADVKGIDLIISGHTHVPLAKPLTVNGVLIVQNASYGRTIGKLHLSVSGGKATVKKYEVLKIDDTVLGDSAITTMVDGYIKGLDTLLSPGGLGFKKAVAETTFDLAFPAYQETGLGDMITDAYRTITAALDTTDPPLVSIEAGGVIRDGIYKGKTGKIWFADMLRALPLGAGPDGKPGYPLVTFYLNGKDLKAGMEVIDLAKNVLKNNDYFLQVSGLKTTIDSKGAAFNRVTEVMVGTNKVNLTDTTKCYRVVTNLYVGSMMASVASATYGQLKIEPKMKDCKTVITSMSSAIFKNKGAEIKQWAALVQYMSMFPDTDSDKIPDVPAKYKQSAGRIIFK